MPPASPRGCALRPYWPSSPSGTYWPQAHPPSSPSLCHPGGWEGKLGHVMASGSIGANPGVKRTQPPSSLGASSSVQPEVRNPARGFVCPPSPCPHALPHLHLSTPLLLCNLLPPSPPFSDCPLTGVMTLTLIFSESFCCVVSSCLFVSCHVKQLPVRISTVDKQIQKINRCVLQMHFTKIISLLLRRSISRLSREGP